MEETKTMSNNNKSVFVQVLILKGWLEAKLRGK